MGKVFDSIPADLAQWLGAQHVFFVATAPLAAGGLVNCSPKGMDTFRILGPREVGYLDLTGSGIETIAHVRENGRLVLMFCAFSGPPRIVRLHARGEVVTPHDAAWPELRPRFPDHAGTRAILRCHLVRIGGSCGYGVPVLEFAGERDTLERLGVTKGEEALCRYRAEKNSQSLDGLPGLDRR